jgi:O-antigen/teichoic acid export membrane protein
MVIFAGIYWRIDVLMLSKLGSIDDVGYYSSAYRLYELAAIFPSTICLSLYPHISVAIHRDSDEVATLGTTALRYLIAIGLLIAVCTTLLAAPILSLLFGQEFVEAHMTLTILIWTVLPYSLVRYQAYVLVAAELQRVDLRLNMLMALINVALNSILIPLSGHAGAAFATLISIIVYAVLQRMYLNRHIPKYKPKMRLEAPVLIASAVIGVGVWYFRDLNVLLLLLFASFFYLFFLVFTGFFSAAELTLLRLDKVVHKLGFNWVSEGYWRKKK